MNQEQVKDTKEEIFIKHNDGCTCNEVYKSRKLPDPECMFHSVDFESPMEEYANLRIAEMNQQASGECERKDKELDIVHRCLTELYNHHDNRVGNAVKDCLDKIEKLNNLPQPPKTKL